MASYPTSACCLIATLHEGETKGKIIKVGENKIDAYVAEPPSDKAKPGKAIILIPDVFGIWKNSQLLADNYAANGYLTILPDLFEGDPVPLERPAGFDIMAWIQKGSDGKQPHLPPNIDPIITSVIKVLKEDYGATKIGAAGYCFGAKYVVRHYKNGIDVGFVAHPSFVEEEELAAITGPLSIASAQVDNIFPVEKRHKSEEILAKNGSPFQITVFSGATHGFGVKADLSVKGQRFYKESAFKQAVAWFDEHLE